MRQGTDEIEPGVVGSGIARRGRLRGGLAVFGLAMLLAGCGGGGDVDSSPRTSDEMDGGSVGNPESSGSGTGQGTSSGQGSSTGQGSGTSGTGGDSNTDAGGDASGGDGGGSGGGSGGGGSGGGSGGGGA